MPILIYALLFKITKRISIPYVFNDDIPTAVKPSYSDTVAYPRILSGGGGSTNPVEDREKGDLGAVAP